MRRSGCAICGARMAGRGGSGGPDDELPEQVESTSDDPGGMPYDDDLGADAEGPVQRGGPAYDSAKSLTDRNIALPTWHRSGCRSCADTCSARWGGADLGILAKPPRAVRAGATPEPAQLGHRVGLAVAGSRSRASGRRRGDRVLHRQRRRSRHPGRARLRGHPVLEVERRMAPPEHRTRRPVWASHGHSGCTSSATGRRPTWRRRSTRWSEVAGPTRRDRHRSGAGTGARHPMPSGSSGQSCPRAHCGAAASAPTSARLQDFLRQFGFADFTRAMGCSGRAPRRRSIEAQQALAEKSLYTAEIDGIWGPKTHAAATQLLAELGR